MYYLLETQIMFGYGGESISAKLIFCSKDKEKLKNILLKKFDEAVDSIEVEYINDYERNECDDVREQIENTLEIKYVFDGFDGYHTLYQILFNEDCEKI